MRRDSTSCLLITCALYVQQYLLPNNIWHNSSTFIQTDHDVPYPFGKTDFHTALLLTAITLKSLK